MIRATFVLLTASLTLGVPAASAAGLPKVFGTSEYNAAFCQRVVGTLDIFWHFVSAPGGSPPCTGIEFTNGTLADAADGAISTSGVSGSNVSCTGLAAYSLSLSADKSQLTGSDTLNGVPLTLTRRPGEDCFVGHWVNGGVDYIGHIAAAPFGATSKPASEYKAASCQQVKHTLDIHWEYLPKPNESGCTAIEFTDGSLQDAADGTISMSTTSVSDGTCIGSAKYTLAVSADKTTLSGSDTLANVPMTLTRNVGEDCYVGHWVSGAADYLAHIAAAPFGASDTPLNVQGLWWAAPAGSQSGWGINFAHQGNTVFATWFTYNFDGKALWLAVAATRTAPGVYTGDVFVTQGPPFTAVPFDSSKVGETTVGTATFTFADDNNGRFDYTVDPGGAGPVTQTRTLVRQIFASPVAQCVWGAQDDLAAAANYQDLWWAKPAGSESGWGINFTHQGDVVFATWFTYDDTGKPRWLAFVANRTAPGVYSGDVFSTTGPAFSAVPFDPAGVVETTVGTATLTFIDGNNATFDYTVAGFAQTRAITRQVFVDPGTVCTP